MIKSKKLDIEKLKDIYRYNCLLLYSDLQSISIINSKIFNTLLNKVIEYQKNDLTFGSLDHLSTTLNGDIYKISYSEICDFIAIIDLKFYFFENEDFFNFRRRINKDFLQLSHLKLSEFIIILNNDENYDSYLRKKKIKELNYISTNCLPI